MFFEYIKSQFGFGEFDPIKVTGRLTPKKIHLSLKKDGFSRNIDVLNKPKV